MASYKTLVAVVPMSREELRMRGRKNTRHGTLRQLWWVDGLGNDYMLLGPEMERLGLADKWPRYINADYGIRVINAMRRGDVQP